MFWPVPHVCSVPLTLDLIMAQSTPHRHAAHEDGENRPAAERPRVRFSVASLAGSHAQINQDSHSTRSPDFFAVADGVGGGSLGEVASAMVVRHLAQLADPVPERVTQSLQAADAAIAERMRKEGHGPGAAVCAAVWRLGSGAKTWLTMVVGDCRVGVLAPQDGSWRVRWSSPLQTYQSMGWVPPKGVNPQAPINMVGCGMSLPAHFETMTLVHGERLILCSDGFHQVYPDDLPVADWSTSGDLLTEDTAASWCAAARQAGAQDDVTVLLVEPDLSPDRSFWRWVCLALFAIGAIGLGWHEWR